MAEKIQLEFHNSSLSGGEEEVAEKMGMLILASDFVGSRKINKAEKVERISRANLTYLLSRTKSGDYLAINPFSDKSLNVNLTTLPSLSSITEYVSDRNNLDLNKLHDKMMEFETKETQIMGGFDSRGLDIIEQFLQAPKSNRKDFETLKPTRDPSQIKEDIKSVNSLVYDEKSLDKEINERLDIIQDALKEEMEEYEQKYKERDQYWQGEIENKNELLAKRLKEREKQLDKDIQAEEDKADKQIAKNLEKFRKGVAKNIRKDEKPIEKSIKNLEDLVGKKPSRDLVDKIDKELTKLSDFTKIFSEAVGFALRQVDIVKQKEEDILELKDINIERLREQAEKDKEQLRNESKRKEKEREQEMKQLKEDRDAVKQRYAKFRDLRDEWAQDMRSAIGEQDTPMVSKHKVPSSSDNPKTVEIKIPTYLFQYTKENDNYNIFVPPVKIANNLSKGSFNGNHGTVNYDLVVPDSENLITDFFLKNSESLELQTNIQNLKNILDDPADLRDTFYSNQNFLTSKLKVHEGKLKKANSRLNDIFASG